MDNKFVDLHVHSYYSDGTMSPLEIVEKAKEYKLKFVAIADHDATKGSLELLKLLQNTDIHYISAVEIDTVHDNKNFHVLAYGIDLENLEFNKYVNEIHCTMDDYSVELIRNMENDFSELTLGEYNNFTHNNRMGGWKALQYLLHKGITNNLKEGVKFYGKYTKGLPKYPSIAGVCEKIKYFGGYSVLAHPGELIDQNDKKSFEIELVKILSMGIDGIECYYPTHSKEISELCVKICKERDLLITSGSDCHGTFGKTRIGEMDITIEQLNIGKIIKK